MSEGRWRQIEKGYSVPSPNMRAPVIAPASTLARMANAAGATASELRAAGRDDAADLMPEAQVSVHHLPSPDPTVEVIVAVLGALPPEPMDVEDVVRRAVQRHKELREQGK